MWSSLRLQTGLVIISASLFLIVFIGNELLFNSERFELVRGVNWIYLPAGMRLLCTLLFGGAGAIGILIASWLTCIFYFFPDDPLRSFAGSLASAAAPYLVYKLSQYLYGLQSSLTNLSAKRLLVLTVLYSVANPTLHHFWLLMRGEPLGSSYLVMILGDLIGTLVVIYAIKMLLSRIPRVPPGAVS